jgi:hypothetical protein
MPTFDNKQQTLGKAVLQGRLSGIIRRLDHARDAYYTAPKKKLENGNTAQEQLHQDVRATIAELEALYRDTNENLAEETTLGKEYDKELFERTLAITLEDVQKQFGHQPNICATLQMFVMLLQTRLDFNAHFLHLRTQCCVEDRSKGNNSAYGINGEPRN